MIISKIASKSTSGTMKYMDTFVYDPTATDSQSKVRGIGRFVQTLKETLPKDVVFTSDPSNIPYDSVFINPFINLVQTPVVNKRLAKIQIGVIHDVIPLQFPKHFPIGVRGAINVWKNKRSLKNYDLIVTDSEVSQKNILKQLSLRKNGVRVIFPTLPKTFSSQARENTKYQKPNTKYFIYVGDVTWNKNLVNLAKAVQMADATCVFVGKTFIDEVPLNSWTKEFHEFMNLAKKDKRFIFPGFVSDEDLKILYKNSVANILVSREEGLGFSYVEAASQKTSSILSDIDIFHETAGDTAIFVDPENPRNIADVLKKMVTEEKKLATLGQKAFERWQSLFEPTDRWADLLTSLQTQQ